MTSLEELRTALERFGAERDWQQFHSPKNLAMALAIEASELMEHFQWLSEEESRQIMVSKPDAVREEIADVLMYTVLLASKLNIDLLDAAERKLALNHERYPADKVRGSAKKHDEY